MRTVCFFALLASVRAGRVRRCAKPIAPPRSLRELRLAAPQGKRTLRAYRLEPPYVIASAGLELPKGPSGEGRGAVGWQSGGRQRRVPARQGARLQPGRVDAIRRSRLQPPKSRVAAIATSPTGLSQGTTTGGIGS